MSEGMAYISRKPCGCIVWAMVDEENPSPQYKRELARELANCIRHGETIERVTAEFVRQQKFDCPHKEPTKQRKVKETRQKTLL
jgi:hypothetical protein